MSGGFSMVEESIVGDLINFRGLVYQDTQIKTRKSTLNS